MKVPTALLVHEVTVEPLAGESSVGRVYGAPFVLPCFAEGKRRMVRSPSSGGAEVLSTLTLYANPGQAAGIPPGSRVTWGGVATVVIEAAERDSGGLGAPDHTEVMCE